MALKLEMGLEVHMSVSPGGGLLVWYAAKRGKETMSHSSVQARKREIKSCSSTGAEEERRVVFLSSMGNPEVVQSAVLLAGRLSHIRT